MNELFELLVLDFETLFQQLLVSLGHLHPLKTYLFSVLSTTGLLNVSVDWLSAIDLAKAWFAALPFDALDTSELKVMS